MDSILTARFLYLILKINLENIDNFPKDMLFISCDCIISKQQFYVLIIFFFSNSFLICSYLNLKFVPGALHADRPSEVDVKICLYSHLQKVEIFTERDLYGESA